MVFTYFLCKFNSWEADKKLSLTYPSLIETYSVEAEESQKKNSHIPASEDFKNKDGPADIKEETGCSFNTLTNGPSDQVDNMPGEQVSLCKKSMPSSNGKSRISCNICNKELSAKYLKIYVAAHCRNDCFKCDTCGKILKTEYQKKTHQLAHMKRDNLSCHICNNITFRSESRWETHQLAHINGKDLKCGVCGKCFVWSSSLKKHRLIHAGAGARVFKCDICEKSFLQKGNLKAHQLSHNDTDTEPGFKCNICGQYFVMKSNLTTHIKTHTGVKDFKCEICGKAFTQSGALKSHSLLHSGRKDFECETCGKRFRQKGNMKKHQMTHSSIMVFKCGICGKNFNRSRNLEKHLLIHASLAL